MKKKVISLCLVMAMIAIALVGASFSYFTDTDIQKNTFVVGDVTIDLYEDFNTAGVNLIPAVKCYTPSNVPCEFCKLDDDDKCGDDACTDCVNSGWHNQIEKEVYVKNVGDEATYVRVHIAIPDLSLTDGTSLEAIALQHDPHTTVDGEWIWGATKDNHYPPRDTTDGTGWNQYGSVTISGVPYKVFVVTYESVLGPGEVTPDAIRAVHMDPVISRADIAAWDALYSDLGGWSHVYVVAEAVQSDGFPDAFTALNAAFGNPLADGYVGPDWTAVSEGDEFVELDNK